jgi:hypothetical protein
VTNIKRAIEVGLNSEREWNAQMRVAGWHAGHVIVPPLRYRLGRAAHMGFMAIRENVACAIAPWLDPDGENEKQHIEAHLS